MNSIESDIAAPNPPDPNILKILIEERDKHQTQILSANGRFSFSILAIAVGVIYSAPKLKGIATDPVWLGFSIFFFASASFTILWALVSHYSFHVDTIRFLEAAAQTYSSSGRLPKEFTDINPALDFNPFRLVDRYSLFDFGHMVLYTNIALLLGALCFLVAIV